MTDSGSTRRAFAAAVGTIAVGALAGCTGSGTEQTAAEGEIGDESTATTAETPTSASGGDEASFDGWFDDVSNYDGVVDETGNSEVTVAVGASGNDANYAFDPAAVRVDSGTTVVWEWTGEGGSHNVAAADGSFESEMVTESGHTFEEAGTYEYVCAPHEAMGMKGAVVVE